jgi:chorismate mutase
MKNGERDLRRWRLKIDKADRQIIKAFGERFVAVKKIGVVKQKWKIPVVQAPRWNDLMRNRRQLARKVGISVEFIEQIYRLIKKEAVRLQKKKRS